MALILAMATNVKKIDLAIGFDEYFVICREIMGLSWQFYNPDANAEGTEKAPYAPHSRRSPCLG